MSSYFAQFGCVHGPVSNVPEDYEPEVVISDEKFDAIYARRDMATKMELFHARDYSLVQFNKIVKQSYEEGTYVSPEELLCMFSNERLEALFWALEGCSCCWTHCHNRPKSIHSWEDESMLDRATQAEIDASRCHCQCRMWKRKLRRALWGVWTNTSVRV
jgi:hypothetical protein